MAESLDKRELIMDEVLARLNHAFKRATIVEGDAGVWGRWANTRTAVTIHVFELETQHQKGRNQAEIVVLPIQIEYVTRITSKTHVYKEGRQKLKELKKAIELDERLTQGITTEFPQQELVVDYGLHSTKIVELQSNIVDAAVQYHFTYVDTFYGYQRKHH